MSWHSAVQMFIFCRNFIYILYRHIYLSIISIKINNLNREYYFLLIIFLNFQVLLKNSSVSLLDHSVSLLDHSELDVSISSSILSESSESSVVK
jgi:hypothetical protein